MDFAEMLCLAIWHWFMDQYKSMAQTPSIQPDPGYGCAAAQTAFQRRVVTQALAQTPLSCSGALSVCTNSTDQLLLHSKDPYGSV